jgi:transcriptional regulator with XRE-family HTH domain
LEKIGLMPLTGIPEIATRTGISHSLLETIPRSNTQHNATKLALIERFEKDPAKRHLLSHPKLWALARIRELAPSHNSHEIKKILETEANELNAKYPSGKKKAPARWQVSSQTNIARIIQEECLRNPEDLSKILSRAHTRRTENQLTQRERDHLLTVAYQRLQNMSFMKSMPVSAEEMRDLLFDRLQKEVKLFNPGNHSMLKELEHNWMAFLFSRGPGPRKKAAASRMDFFIIDILRQKGPFRRDRTPRKLERRPRKKLGKKQGFPRPVSLPSGIANRLTAGEKQVLQLSVSGSTPKQIAYSRGTSIRAVLNAFSSIRRKVRE